MWLVWVVSSLSALAVAGFVFVLRRDLRTAPRGWQLLAGSAIPLALGGLGFIVRFWVPLPGPYRANDTYPLGPYLNAWAVSFGFMWLAFGLTFFALALRAPRSAQTWWLLLTAWLLAWLPHGIIGAGFALAGSNGSSLHLYRGWASELAGLVQLCASALVLLAHFGMSLAGFVLAFRALRRASRTAVAA